MVELNGIRMEGCSLRVLYCIHDVAASIEELRKLLEKEYQIGEIGDSSVGQSMAIECSSTTANGSKQIQILQITLYVLELDCPEIVVYVT